MSVAALAGYRRDWATLRSLADGVVSTPLTCCFFTVYVVFIGTLCLYEVLVLLVEGHWQLALVILTFGANLFLFFIALCCTADSASKAVSGRTQLAPLTLTKITVPYT